MPPKEASTEQSGAIWLIQNKASETYLNVKGNSMSPADITIYNIQNTASQWQLLDHVTGQIHREPVDGEDYCIRNVNSGLYMTVKDNSSGDGGIMWQYPLQRHKGIIYDSQKFRLQAVEDTADTYRTYHIVSVQSLPTIRYLVPKDNQTKDGTQVIQYADPPTYKDVQWNFLLIVGGTGATAPTFATSTTSTTSTQEAKKGASVAKDTLMIAMSSELGPRSGWTVEEAFKHRKPRLFRLIRRRRCGGVRGQRKPLLLSVLVQGAEHV